MHSRPPYCFRRLLSTHSISRRVPYSARHVYAVVSEIEKYHEFVPWCTKAEIVRIVTPHREIVADLTVGFHGIKEETFRSDVFLEPFKSVTARVREEDGRSGPLKSLTNEWRFEGAAGDECTVYLALEFEFRNQWYARLSGMVLDRVADAEMKAFLKRCERVVPSLEVEDSAEKRVIPVKMAIHSDRLDADMFSSLAACTRFKEHEIERLAHEFSKRRDVESGRLSKDAFAAWLDCGRDTKRIGDYAFGAICWFGSRAECDGLTLRGFIGGLSVMVRGLPEEKCRIWFSKLQSPNMTREDLELITSASLVVRRAVNKSLDHSLSGSGADPQLTAVRLVTPVFRGSINGEPNPVALERLISTL